MRGSPLLSTWHRWGAPAAHGQYPCPTRLETERGYRFAAPPRTAFSSSENSDASVVWLHLGAAPQGPGSVYTPQLTGPSPCRASRSSAHHGRRGRHSGGPSGAGERWGEQGGGGLLLPGAARGRAGCCAHRPPCAGLSQPLPPRLRSPPSCPNLLPPWLRLLCPRPRCRPHPAPAPLVGTAACLPGTGLPSPSAPLPLPDADAGGTGAVPHPRGHPDCLSPKE